MPPPRLSGRRRGNDRGAGIKFWIVLMSGFLIIGGMVGSGIYYQNARTRVNATSPCPLRGPTAVHAILIDRSDPISPLQADRLRQMINQVTRHMPVGGRIDMYVADSNGWRTLRPVVSLCNPGNTANPLYQNPGRMHQKYEDAFRKPVEVALASLMVPSSTTMSPIMESIKAVCVQSFGGIAQGVPVGLTIASDMVQNSPALDQYRPYSFDKFAKGPGLPAVLANCHKAAVSVLYFLRPTEQRIQGRLHELFWERFFRRDNAILARVEAI